jgi:hypothetical protein
LKELLVFKKLLSFDKLRVLVVVNVLGEDSHGVIVLLAKEQDVQARLLVVLRVEGEGALSKHRLQVARHQRVDLKKIRLRIRLTLIWRELCFMVGSIIISRGEPARRVCLLAFSVDRRW